MNIARESYALVLVCLADLVSTIFFVSYRSATEGNPLMAYYLSHSLGAFVGIKLVLCLMPLFLMEYARQHRPQSARLGLRVALAGYLFSYVAGVSQLNPAVQPIGRPAPSSVTNARYQHRKVQHDDRAQMALHLATAAVRSDSSGTAAMKFPPREDR